VASVLEERAAGAVRAGVNDADCPRPEDGKTVQGIVAAASAADPIARHADRDAVRSVVAEAVVSAIARVAGWALLTGVLPVSASPRLRWERTDEYLRSGVQGGHLERRGNERCGVGELCPGLGNSPARGKPTAEVIGMRTVHGRDLPCPMKAWTGETAWLSARRLA